MITKRGKKERKEINQQKGIEESKEIYNVQKFFKKNESNDDQTKRKGCKKKSDANLNLIVKQETRHPPDCNI